MTQTIKSGTLARQWNLLSHVFRDIVRCCFDLSICDNFVEAACGPSAIVSAPEFPVFIADQRPRTDV